MKNLFLLLVFFFASYGLKANEPVVLEENIQTEFKQLNDLEEYLEANPASLKELQEKNSPLVANVLSSENSTFLDGSYEETLGIPAFLWGCVFGLIGILLVYILTDKDKSITKKAAMGCLVTYGTFALVYLVYFIVVLSVASSF